MELRKKKPASWMRRFTAVLLVIALLFTMGLTQMVHVSIARQSQADNELSAAVNALVGTTGYLEKNTPERMLELVGASLSSRESVEYAYTMASVHIGRQEYNKALEYIDQCIRLYSHNDPDILTEFWFKKGCLLTLTNSDAEAISALDHALSINPKLADAHYVKMQVHVKQGDLALAVRDVEMYRRLTGGQDITAVQGDLYAAQEIYTEAVTAYDQAILADPNNWHALFMRGLSHLQLGNYELSLDDFSRCIQHGQEAALSLYYRGVLLLRKGEYALAEADFNVALQGDAPGRGLMELWFNRGVSRMAQGNMAAALKDFTESAARGEAVGESLINSGICLQELGQSHDALERYAAAQENGVAVERLNYYRARTYSAMGDHSLAVSAYTSSIDGGFERPESLLQRGAAYYALGAYQEAIADFSACISSEYKAAEALYLRGMTYLQMGREAESQMDLEAAITAGDKI